jgi:predicted nucleic acid-binding protein
LKALLETSVLVATFYGDHEHHAPSLEIFLRYDRDEACCAAHSLAEVYASLTGMPGRYRVSPDEAMLFLGNIRDRFSVVALSEADYYKALNLASANRVLSGGIYDALLVEAAVRTSVKTLYTWNVKHFNRIASGLPLRITTP